MTNEGIKEIRKLKINAKRAIIALIIGIIEVLFILGLNQWQFTPWVFISIANTMAIFEKKLDK